MLVLIFSVGCIYQNEPNDPKVVSIEEDPLFTRQYRYRLPIKDNFPQVVVEALQSCTERSCYVDVFESTIKNTVQEYYFLHSGEFALLLGGSDKEPISKVPILKWHRVNGILSYCVGDPLQYQSIGLNIDREISIEVLDDRYKWIVKFNGNNICELNGILKIGIFDESIDTSGLIVHSKPWTRGGSVYLHEKMLPLGIETLGEESNKPF